MWEANPSESALSEARPPRACIEPEPHHYNLACIQRLQEAALRPPRGLETPAPGPPEGPKSRSRMRTREARPPLGGPKVAGVSPAAGDDW